MAVGDECNNEKLSASKIFLKQVFACLNIEACEDLDIVITIIVNKLCSHIENGAILIDNEDGTFTFTHGGGVPVTIDYKKGTVLDNGDDTYTITDDFGNTININTKEGVSIDVGNIIILGADGKPYLNSNSIENIGTNNLVITDTERDLAVSGLTVTEKVVTTDLVGAHILELRGDKSAKFAGLSKPIYFGDNAYIFTDTGAGDAQLVNFKYGMNFNANNFTQYNLKQMLLGSSVSIVGTNILAIKNGTAPIASTIDHSLEYSADIAVGNSARHFKSEDGNIQKIFTGAAVSDASGGATVDTEARAAINTLLSRFRVIGGNGFIEG